MWTARLLSFGLTIATVACVPSEPPIVGDVELARAWESETFAGCVLASPLAFDTPDGPRIVVATGDGRVAAIDPDDGTTVWSVSLPHGELELAHVISTPVIVAADRLVVTWQLVLADSPDPAAAPRSGHRVAVVDLSRGVLDEAFPILTLAGSRPSTDGSGPVEFRASNALSRSRLVHATTPGRELGLVYVSFGNARDIQPWHGWVFELDLDAWRSAGVGSAISSLLLTSPENACGTPGTSGSSDMICGGGVWAPTGPIVVPDDEGSFELIVPTGNGALDLDRRTYANTLMRIHGPGLAFDPRCDALLCAGWTALDGSDDCIASCEDLFVPRHLETDPPFDAPGCEGLGFFECYAALDWDLGADSPARVELGDGRAAYVLPAKDGSVYLLDAEHLGTLFDRLQLVEACGAGGVHCDANWAGMMVTQPAITEVDGAPFALIATFMPDAVHSAGLVGVRIVMRDGAPRLERAWEAPSFESDASRTRFRRHPSGVRLVRFGGVEYAAIVEQGRLGESAGALHLVRVSDGEIVARVDLDGPGQRYAQPLAIEDRLFVPSCDQGNVGPGHLEAWDLRAALSGGVM